MKFLTYVLLVTVVFTFTLSGYKLYQVKTHPLKYTEEIIKTAETYNLDKTLVSSIINVESSFNKDAKSNKNAIGLMQIKLDTANYLNSLENKKDISENELFTPSINIEYGCKYLRYLINKFGDVTTSLCAYNAGETRVMSWLKSDYSLDGKTLNFIPFEETRNYIVKIEKNVKFYEKYFK